jgi:SAM-dependent methyltransferase
MTIVDPRQRLHRSDAEQLTDQPICDVAPDLCLVCASPARQTLYPTTYTGSVEQAPAYFLAHRTATAHGTIVRCLDCGFVFTSPRFRPEDYDQIYKNIKRPASVDPSFHRANIARLQRLCTIVREYQSVNGPFLDFGCGDGVFLRQFDNPAGRGFEVGAAGRYTVGQCEVFTGDWTTVAGSGIFPADSFDFVVAFDVLEHLPRIDQDLALIRRVLRLGGAIFVTVPNIQSFAARMMGGHWNMLLLEHLWYFSPATLQRLMTRHGFEQLTTRSVPFDASLAHLMTRMAQTFGMTGTLDAGPISKLVLPLPAGHMLSVFRKTN